MFEIGQTVAKENYTASAAWCNQHGAHIEKQNGAYVIVQNAPVPEPSLEDKVAARKKYLAETDWYAVRLAETGKPIPEDILSARQAARNEIDALREV